jgi:transposase InsO family protein
MPRLGTRKLYYLLKKDSVFSQIKMGRDVLFNFLRAEHLLIRPLKQYTKTTDSKHWLKKYPNLIQTLVVDRPEQLWVSDITYIKAKEGNLYLSMVTDAYSRKIMGYSIADNMEANTVAISLKMALKQRRYPSHALIHHSDRGLQYCSRHYVSVAAQGNITMSMTQNGDPYENALAERMNRTIKEEFGLNNIIASKENTIKLVNDAIRIYNQSRPHLSLKMKTPNFVHKQKIPAT